MKSPLLMSLFDEAERRPLTVSELTTQVRETLESRFKSVWLEGEISNFKQAASGHWYFTIKDEFSQIRASCFRGSNYRIRFKPSDGLQVRARGRLTVYEPRGEYELVVESLEPVGAGALKVAFEQLKERLAKEGLFDEELKRPLPLFPHRVGVVTSPSGAAIRDIINVLSRRTRTVNIVLAPSRVQGEGASEELAAAIELLNDYHREALKQGRYDNTVDVIIIGRGGGSVEDLWAFNDEKLARAIRVSQIPVISAVGHETDFTIADFVADMRAPTPSAAAEMVAAREDELEAFVEERTRDLIRAVRYELMDKRSRLQESAMSPAFDEVRERLRDAQQAIESAKHRIEKIITNVLQRSRRRADSISYRLSPASLSARVMESKTRFSILCAARDAAIAARVDEAQSHLGVMAASLDALSPLAVLSRGYAMVHDQNERIIRSSRNVDVDDEVKVKLAEGSLRCRVLETKENE
jgi:exodeoxyribonuclease VII large subunit